MTNIDTGYTSGNRARTAPREISSENFGANQSIYNVEQRKIDLSAPGFEGRDIMAASLATLMMLAPLAAYAVGWGA
jgi:hypothetical protein